jgi:tripartite-type tricarboxylate transporter receptor subunit TctC
MNLEPKWSLRSTALAVAAIAAVSALPSSARAQAYPSQDIRIICAFPPGSGADVLVRYFADKLRPLAGRTVIVENKAGAGGNISQEYVARAKPDGYTMLVHAATAVAANQHLFKKPPIDAAKAFQIAASINRQPFMLVVDAKSPHKTVAELTEAMRKKGDKATYASAAPTGTIMGEIYKDVTGVKAVEVNYKTAPDSLNELLSGKVDYGMHDPVFSLAQQREGRLRILAVSTARRLEANPDLPTMTESGVPMDLTGWWAAVLPSATSRPVIDKINEWFVEIVKTEETRKFLNGYGGDPFINTPDAAQALFLKSIKDWGEYVRIAKITPQ